MAAEGTEYTPVNGQASPHRLITTPVQEEGDRPDIGFFATSDIPPSELDSIKTSQNWEVLLTQSSGTETLSLSRCELVTLPSEVPGLTQLTRLYLTYNNLKTLPDEFKKLINLTRLNLGSNEFSTIPKVIFKLKKLKVLYLKNNKLKSDAIVADIQKLDQLEELYLSHNALDSFPVAVCRMENLLMLTLSDNSIADIPGEISKMKKLKVLKLRSNMLKKIPASFGELEGLELACFAQNMIDEFPFIKVGRLCRLRDLCVYANRLADGEALERCSQILAERGGTFRADDNRVVIQRMGGPLQGICDGPYDVWKVDVVWLYDGDESVKSWIDDQIAELGRQKGYLASKVFGPSDEEMKGVLKHSRIVCVVCTSKMCQVLNGEEPTLLRNSLQKFHRESRDPAIWAVMHDTDAGVSPFLMRNGCNSDNVIEGYRGAFIYELINVINTGTREAPLSPGRNLTTPPPPSRY